MRKKGISFVLSLAMVAGLAPNVANAAEKADDVQAFLNSRNAVEAKEGPTGDLKFEITRGDVEEVDGISLDDAVSIEVAARDYNKYENNYVYNKLTSSEKAFYDGLKQMCENYINSDADVTLTDGKHYYMNGVAYDGLTWDRAVEILWMFQYQCPQYYFVANFARGTTDDKLVMGVYNDFVNGLSRRNATEKFFSEVDKAVAYVGKQETECLKAKAAHDYICSIVEYDTNFDCDYNQTAWSTFTMGETVCAGYSKAYTIVCNAVGVETVGDTSSLPGTEHAWNRTKVEDGWYYVDCTWDDDPDGVVGTVDYSFFLIGEDKLMNYSSQSKDAHTSETYYQGILPDCPEDFEPGVTAQGIYVAEQDNNKIVAGAVASHSLGKKYLEYQWLVCEDGTTNWTLIQDWNDSEWLGWAPKRTGNYVIVCKVRDKINGDEVQISTGVNFVINEANIIGKCQMPWWGPEGGFLIGFTSNTNPNQSYQYEVQILDCTKYANGEDAWVWSAGKHTVSEGTTYWTVWQPEYGYYWTLFIVYDANGTEVGRACYGFENIGE